MWSEAEKLFTFVHKRKEKRIKEKGNKVFLRRNYRAERKENKLKKYI